MNLFQKIWSRNFKKGQESIDKFSEDIGGLEGVFSYTPIVNGIKGNPTSIKNTITHLSKSTVIRLLAQEALSTYKGSLDPKDFKISKMRFGNAPFGSYASIQEKELSYYDPYELSSRANTTDINLATFPTLTTDQIYKSAGGRWPSGLAGKSSTQSGPLSQDSGSIVSLNKTGIFGGATSFSINILDSSTLSGTSNRRPPSHGTLKIELYDSTNALLTTVEFNSQYFRNSGNIATSVSPAPASGTGFNAGDYFASNLLSDHKLTYSSTLNEWTVTISYPSIFSSPLKAIINYAKIKYEIGKYNVIKSIVPTSSFNSGIVTQNPDNYYNILPSSIKLGDSSTISAIDDYSATFSVTMNVSEGNGVVDPTDTLGSLYEVVYTEAFLFNQSDDLFSIIKLDMPSPWNTLTPASQTGFGKNSESAYLISWTIKALL
jgi:hypothetical protein